MPALCTITGCGKRAVARGWCHTHHRQWRRTGSPIPGRIYGDDEARFWSHVDKNGPVPEQRPDLGPCWQWCSYTSDGGYGRIKVARKWHQAHRWLYELVVGPVPDGLELDHLCRNRGCVNPAHLEPVTPSVNTRRGAGPGGVNAAKTHCDSGHEFTPANTYRRHNGARTCRTCLAVWRERAKERAA